jgi:hypothetical protein
MRGTMTSRSTVMKKCDNSFKCLGLLLLSACANEPPLPDAAANKPSVESRAGSPVASASAGMAAPPVVAALGGSASTSPAGVPSAGRPVAAGGAGSGATGGLVAGTAGSTAASGAAASGTGGSSPATGSAGTPAAPAEEELPDLSGLVPPLSTPDNRPPAPDNPPECPAVAPENPVGDCLGLPIYVACNYGTYSCTCDWYHWLCFG